MNNNTKKLLDEADKWCGAGRMVPIDMQTTGDLVRLIVAMRTHISAGIDSRNELLRIIKECQEKLAIYIVPDSGVTDFEVVNQLLGILDHRDNLAKIIKAENK